MSHIIMKVLGLVRKYIWKYLYFYLHKFEKYNLYLKFLELLKNTWTCTQVLLNVLEPTLVGMVVSNYIRVISVTVTQSTYEPHTQCSQISIFTGNTNHVLHPTMCRAGQCGICNCHTVHIWTPDTMFARLREWGTTETDDGCAAEHEYEHH